jgi:hypothetical protein
MNVIAIPGEYAMLSHTDHDDKVAGRPAIPAFVAKASLDDFVAIVNAGRN